MDSASGSQTPPAATQLVGLARSDSRVADLYAIHFPQLVALATLLSGGSSGGEEVAQETFVIALRLERQNPGYLRDPAWPWLRVTATRLATRWRRRYPARIAALGLWAERLPSTQRLPDESVDLMRAVGRLPWRMRVCTVLAYLEDQRTASIADALGCSVKNVEFALREGRRRLRKDLGESYGLR